MAAVHPRGRGEHLEAGDVARGSVGSSPRARGTPADHSAGGVADRFIPAGAGTLLRDDHARSPSAVHPRGRGNTPGRRGRALRKPVHPRGRGEHIGNIRTVETIDGSSPRARGTRWHRRCPRRSTRFIPAGAGNTGSRRSAHAVRPVHPRGRGEHERFGPELTAINGSSPRAREHCHPAAAGHGLNGSSPRAREHSMARAPSTMTSGSSPRARGTRLLPGGPDHRPRFIPAGAGNTLNATNCSIKGK